jgi:glycosyltransferase involved in cell wall biosynthesis
VSTTTSIIISSHNRLPLFRRTLWAIANRPPSVPFEVVVVDDGSTEDVLGELRLYSSKFPWTFARFVAAEFEAKTGLKKFLNNPCATNNLAFKLAKGDYIFQQGNEVIAYGDVYDRLIADSPGYATQKEWSCRVEELGGFRQVSADPSLQAQVKPLHWMVMSTTLDLRRDILDRLDQYGTNLSAQNVHDSERWPLQSRSYPSDVTNYISLAPRALWEALGGYDERYYGGISAEDSDFVRRARKLPGFVKVVSDGLSLHQFHSGKTCYYSPPPSVITQQRWDDGVAINHAIFHNWNGEAKNPQRWPWGTYGLGEVVTNQ